MIWPLKKKLTMTPLPKNYSVRTYLRVDENNYIKLLNTDNVFGLWHHNRLQNILNNPLSPHGIFFIIYKNKMVGTSCSLERTTSTGKKWGELGWVFVSPSHRRKGLGTILSYLSINHLLKQNYKEIFVTTSFNRTPAIETYLKMGFLQIDQK